MTTLLADAVLLATAGSAKFSDTNPLPETMTEKVH
jgi:hypothetical protein